MLRGLLVMALLLGGCGGKNLAERLGYPADAKLLILHADDLGTFRAVNRAYISMQEAGMVSSAAMNAPGKDFDEMAKYLKEHPDLDVGVHVNGAREHPTRARALLHLDERHIAHDGRLGEQLGLAHDDAGCRARARSLLGPGTVLIEALVRHDDRHHMGVVRRLRRRRTGQAQHRRQQDRPLPAHRRRSWGTP